jgi:DNA mismatch endonuclease, patch repair protein
MVPMASSPRTRLPTTVERSRLMGAVRQHGTRPELIVRKVMSELGLRYRLNVVGLPGRPDLANQSRGMVVFVHGCFWHRHRGCSKATTPSNNRGFWLRKFSENVARDEKNISALRRLGFSVIVVWECETTDKARLAGRLKRLVQQAHGEPRSRRRNLAPPLRKV